MAEAVSIRAPALLHVKCGGCVSCGANQAWYPSWIKRASGCGPTAASNLLWYLCASRPETCGGLCGWDCRDKAGMLRLMQSVWRYVTPGMRGVDKASVLAGGAVRYGAEKGVKLEARVLEVPKDARQRPTAGEVWGFLSAAFCGDLPVAFLNLSNGAVENLESWHWVTLVSADGDLQAGMYDQSRQQAVDLALWLDSTVNGGAFVAIQPHF